ncbi:MAG TPA: NAD-dependent epimerase/dehydratase family protein [Phycisphaerae bacterium]|nr:NAD-dependent epimerase/dehydratase family protein [Phycisphaerae bacterium]
MEPEADQSVNLVTGGTGLLGSHIVEQLVRRGHRVRALVRAGADVRFLQSQGVELVEGDITNRASLDRTCRGVDRVFHSAARVGDWGPWSEFVQITVGGTRNLVDAAAEAGVKRFLHISSISAYGHPDGEGLVLDESAPLGQKLHRWSYYSRAKVAAEEIVWEAHREGRIAVTVIRPSWLYGPRDRASIGRLIDSIRTRKVKLIGRGDNRLNVVHAANVAEGTVLAAFSDSAAGEAYNCCNDGIMTQEQYFNRIATALGEPPVTRRVPYRVAHTAALVLECVGHLFRLRKPPLVTRYSVWLIGRRCFFECRKAREQLGWKSTISYEEGIPAAVEDYLQTHNDGRPD